jgi:subtilisin family serine protease
MRVLLAAALVVAVGVEDSRAQGPCITNLCPSPTTPGPAPSHNNNVIWYIVGGVVVAIIGVIIAQHFGDPGPPAVEPPSPPPPSPPPVAQLPATPRPTGPGQPTQQALRPSCNLPAANETRFVNNEIVVDMAGATDQAMEAVAARYGLTRVETTTIRLTGRTLHRWRIEGGNSVRDMIPTLCTERLVAGLQPNFLYALTQDQAGEPDKDQYAPQKLHLVEAHRLATGNRVLVAVIDSEVDASHPDLAGAIKGNFDASADDERPHAHGTGMAGAIAAHHKLLGAAPNVSLLTVRAFSTRQTGAEGTTFNILKGLDWAAAQGARVVNMSFAGPSDPRLRDALDKAYKKGMVLVAAAGNAGAKSPPQFPGADKNVIAVTATDSNDVLFAGANRGDYVAVAAPGVDILAPAPDGVYQLTTGTSVASAEISGVVALLIERNPALTPADVRRILMSTAKDLGPKGKDRDYGAGLVDALRAVTAAAPKR